MKKIEVVMSVRCLGWEWLAIYPNCQLNPTCFMRIKFFKIRIKSLKRFSGYSVQTKL